MKIKYFFETFFFWLIDLLIPDSILIQIVRFNNKLFGHFVIYKINSDLGKLASKKQGPEYWRSLSAIYYFIYAKNLNLKNTPTEDILNKLSNEIEHLDIETRYLEIGCGYPIYLKSAFLKKKIKNYYGYDVNPYIANFFNVQNVFNSYPENDDYDIILILSGVIKYFSEEELVSLLEIINKINPKKIIISHNLDYKIIKNKIYELKSKYKFNNVESINLILI